MMYCGIMITAYGSISVLSSTMKIRSRPGKRKRAKPYAASDEVSSTPTMLNSVMNSVFNV